jgi:hypothetical protein
VTTDLTTLWWQSSICMVAALIQCHITNRELFVSLVLSSLSFLGSPHLFLRRIHAIDPFPHASRTRWLFTGAFQFLRSCPPVRLVLFDHVRAKGILHSSQAARRLTCLSSAITDAAVPVLMAIVSSACSVTLGRRVRSVSCYHESLSMKIRTMTVHM